MRNDLKSLVRLSKHVHLYRLGLDSYRRYIIIEYHVIGSIFGKRYLLAIDHIMLALFWSYVLNMK